MMPASTLPGNDRLMLPEQYIPTNDVCIIGRGNGVRQHPGNVKFYALIDSNLVAYQSAATKGLKSDILWKILTEIRNHSKDNLGFVKKDPRTGRWCAVEDHVARANIAQAFRDRLSGYYKSSKQHKSIKRKYGLGLIGRKEDCQLIDDICTSLIYADSYKCNDPYSVKRICLAQPMMNSFPTTMPKIDASDGRINQSLGARNLRDILQADTSAAVTVSQEDSYTRTEVDKPASDSLAKLLKRLEATVEATEDPFEPMPITSDEAPMPTEALSSQVMPHCHVAIHQALFEPRPLASAEDTAMLHFSLSSWDFSDFDVTQEGCIKNVNFIWGIHPEPLLSG